VRSETILLTFETMAYVLAKFVFKREFKKDRNICVSIEYRETEIVVLRGWIHQRMKP